jgi:hypothetical protein
LHNHHDAYGYLPPGNDCLLNPGGSPNPWRFPWCPGLPPYIEQDALFRTYRLARGWNDPATNFAAGGPTRKRVDTFLCPSAPRASDRLVGNGADNEGMLDYAAAIRFGGNPNPFVTPAPWNGYLAGVRFDPEGAGLLGETVCDLTDNVVTPCRRKLVQAADGTSNSMLLAEDAGRNHRYIQGVEVTAPDVPAATWSSAQWGANGSRLPVVGFDPSWPRTSPTLPTAGPCAVDCINNCEIYSYHQGGANVVVGDVAVKFLRQSTTLETVLVVLTRNGGESMTEDPF